MTRLRSASRSAFTPSATGFQRVDVGPLSVSSRIANFGSSTASWKISLRFFSPPENPSFTPRLSRLVGQMRHLDLSRTSEALHRIQFRLAARLRCALSALRRNVGVVHARDLDRVLEREEHAGELARFRFSTPAAASRRRARPNLGDFVAVATGGMLSSERGLAGAVRTHDRVHFAGLHLEVEALRCGRISRRRRGRGGFSIFRACPIFVRPRMDAALRPRTRSGRCGKSSRVKPSSPACKIIPAAPSRQDFRAASVSPPPRIPSAVRGTLLQKPSTIRRPRLPR